MIVLGKVMRVMPLSSPEPKDTRSRLADWLEVLVLVGTRGVATRADVLSIDDLLGEEERGLERDDETGEDLEEEILEDSRAAFVDQVLEELENRAAVLGHYYPFQVQVVGQSWLLRAVGPSMDAEASAARSCYVFCLLTTAIRDRYLHGVEVPLLERTLPNHFQAIATAAAAGVLGGEVVSFGWPRPEGSAFLPALRQLAQRLRLGSVLATVPLWSNGKEKDSGIDVIAWRDFPDAQPGKLVLLGQVASGHNWTGKSVKSDTPRFMSWFSQHPTEHYIPAIFIPFPQHHGCSGRAGAAFSDVAHAEAWLREQEFGLVIDRLRIVGAAAKSLTGVDRGTLDALGQWIGEALAAAKAAA